MYYTHNTYYRTLAIYLFLLKYDTEVSISFYEILTSVNLSYKRIRIMLFVLSAQRNPSILLLRKNHSG